MKKVIGIGLVVLVGMLVVGTVAVWAAPRSGRGGVNARQSTGGGPAVANPVAPVAIDNLTPGDLSESEAEALQMALDDEYRAWAVYEQVIADFGAVRPFTSIQKAEENHIAALVTLFERYGLEVPANEWAGSIAPFATLAEACEAGVQAEVDNAGLYAQMFEMVDNPDIIQVFTSLQTASQTKHLPAFERCAP